ncbi:MAG TPA: hypothetical protein PKI11_17705, partial [Candidatus Hydrogenedentes bacterium]|nr:hypothetical protein [Candidatus Hydrogenedentota bacterium]
TEVILEVVDFHDNTATITIPVTYEPPSPLAVTVTGPAEGRGETAIECLGEYLVVTVRFTATEPEPPEGIIECDQDIVRLAFVRVNGSTYRAGWKPTVSGRQVLRVHHPRAKTFTREFAAFVRGTRADVQLGEVTVGAERDSAYGALFVGADRVENDGPKPTGLRRVGPVYRLWPEDIPVDAAIRVMVPQPPGLDTRKGTVYRAGGGSWSREGAEFSNGLATVKTRRLGLFGFLEDTTPPAVSDVTPGADATLETRHPRITAAISDRGSGIRDYEVTCGEQWLLTAYDPDQGRISWERDEDLPAGKQEFVIRVTDNAGNETRVTRAVTVP